MDTALFVFLLPLCLLLEIVLSYTVPVLLQNKVLIAQHTSTVTHGDSHGTQKPSLDGVGVYGRGYLH